MKKLCIFLVLMISILGGCSGKYMVFSGESKNWEGNYSTTINGNDEDGSYTFNYKNGDGNTKFKNIEVVISQGGSETSKIEEDYKGAIYKIKSSCQGCAVTSEGEKMKVTIKWDSENEETFFLDQK